MGTAATVRFQRPDGRWLQLSGGGAYADPDALVAVARSVGGPAAARRPAVRLAPAGWRVDGYEESRSLDLVSDTDPAQMPLRVSLTGTPGPGVTVDSFYEGPLADRSGGAADRAGAAGPWPMTTPDDGDNWLVAGRCPTAGCSSCSPRRR